jgi:hypothetical protein
MTDASAQLSEKATYCKLNDPKRPNVVGLPDATTSQICPADGTAADEVTDAYPDGWYVRVMFDELLDPSIETLTELTDDTGMGTGTFSGSIAATHPVTLQCQSAATGAMVNVDYDGYYQPAGNNVTWPLGPSLVIKPNDATLIATGKECQVTLGDVITDKDGNTVPMDERGPFKFKVAPISVLVVDPADSGDATMPTEIDAYTLYFDNPYLQFNTFVDLDSLCPDKDADGLCDGDTPSFTFSPDPGGFCNTTGDPCKANTDCTDPTDAYCETTYAYSYYPILSETEYGVGPLLPAETDKDYAFSFVGGAKLKDRCGGETTLPAPTVENGLLHHYHTNKFDLNSITPATDETAAPTKKLTLNFNNVIDPASLESTEFSLTPTPDGFTGPVNYFGGDLFLGGNYQPNTEYTFVLKAGATVKDAYGVVYTNTSDRTVKWKTEPAFTLKSVSPADNATVQQVAVNGTVSVSLTFNSNIDQATFTTDDFTFVNKTTGAAVPSPSIETGSSAGGSLCTPDSLGCQMRVRAPLAAGTYVFTLKKDAAFKDLLGNTYTNPADKVITFTVKDPAALAQCL